MNVGGTKALIGKSKSLRKNASWILLGINLALLTLRLDAFELTPQAVVESVSQHFPELLMQQEKVRQAIDKTFSSTGEFDPYLSGKFDMVPKGGYEHRYFEATLNQPIENTGSSLQAGYRLGRGDWPVYYQNYLTNDDGELFLGINLPLLQNRTIDRVRQKIQENQLLTKAEQLVLAIKRNDVIRAALDVYWDLVGAAKRIEITQELLSIAKKRQVSIQNQVALGETAQINEVENRRLIAQRHSMLVSDQQKYKNAQAKLQFYMGQALASHPKNTPAFTLPTKKILRFDKGKGQMSNFKRIELNQPYLQFLENKIQQSQLAIKQVRNEMMPGLDFSVYVDKQYGQGSSKLSQTSVNLGLKYKVPLRLRKTEGELAMQQSKIREYKYQKQYFHQKLALTHKNILIDLKAVSDIYHYRSEEKKIAAQLLDAEMQRFSAGESSIFIINQREEIAASTDYLVLDAIVSHKKLANLLSAMCFYNKYC